MRAPPEWNFELKNSDYSNILGEFNFDKHHYFIVNLNTIDSIKGAPLFSILPSSNFSEIIRFEVKGQTCAIFLVDEHSDSDGCSDLTTVLTERELQIATLVALGKVNKQIASELHISEWTVSTHLRRIFAKLGVSSRAAMVYRCASLIC